MVALEQERTASGLAVAEAATGGTLDLDILVDHHVVQDNLLDPGVGDFLSLGVESRGAVADAVALPLAGRLAGLGIGAAAL